jgi:integrase
MRTELIGLDTAEPQFHIPRERVKRRREVIVPLNEMAVSIIGEAFLNERQGAVFFVGSSRPADGDDKTHESLALSRHALSAALTGKPAKGKAPARIGIREHLGLAHFTPHDLRRTAATIARRGGAKREDVKALLDHLEGDVTAVYDKYDMLAEKRAVATILATELRKIIGARAEAVASPNIFDRSNVVPFEERMRIPGQAKGVPEIQTVN